MTWYWRRDSSSGTSPRFGSRACDGIAAMSTSTTAKATRRLIKEDHRFDFPRDVLPRDHAESLAGLTDHHVDRWSPLQEWRHHRENLLMQHRQVIGAPMFEE